MKILSVVTKTGCVKVIRFSPYGRALPSHFECGLRGVRVGSFFFVLHFRPREKGQRVVLVLCPLWLVRLVPVPSLYMFSMGTPLAFYPPRNKKYTWYLVSEICTLTFYLANTVDRRIMRFVAVFFFFF